MNFNNTIWEPDVQVRIEKSVLAGRVVVSFGPTQSHTSWFMHEDDLDMLIKNLLDAKMAYILGGK